MILVPRDPEAELQQCGSLRGRADLQPQTRRAKIQRLQSLHGK